MDLQKNKALWDRVNQLSQAYRIQCLWFLKEDYFPDTPGQAIRVLEQIERHADQDGYIEARKLKEWLLRNTSDRSVG